MYQKQLFLITWMVVRIKGTGDNKSDEGARHAESSKNVANNKGTVNDHKSKNNTNGTTRIVVEVV